MYDLPRSGRVAVHTACALLTSSGYTAERITDTKRRFDIIAWNNSKLLGIVVRTSRAGGIARFSSLVQSLAEIVRQQQFPGEVRIWILQSHEWQRYRVLPGGAIHLTGGFRIRFTSSANRRNPGMLLDLIKSNAALFQFQRKRVNKDGIDVVIASKEDFIFASQIYQALNSVSGGQSTKLTKSESMLIEAIRSVGKTEYTMKEIVDLTGKSYDGVRKLIRGNGEKNAHNALIGKCPAITYLMRTDMTDTGNRSQLVYLWNDKLYEVWSSGGGCWLEEDKDGNGKDGEDGDGPENTSSQVNSGDDLLNPGPNKTDLVIGETGELERAIGERFSPPNEGQIAEYSKNYNNNIELDNDRRKIPGIERPHDQVCAPLSPPESFLRSDEKVETEARTGQDTESEEKSGGEIFSPVFSDRPAFFPVTPPAPPSSTVTAPTATLKLIDPDDYWPINGVWSGPCVVCGGKWVYYNEKFSQKMKAENRSSYKVCKRCYDQAVERKSKSFTVLPVLLNMANMVRADKDIGRCDVCKTGPAVWIDPDTKQKICQVCYAREKETMEELS